MKTEKKVNVYSLITIILLLCNLFVCRLAFVYGDSMKPTLETRDCVLVWKLCYQPRAGDIVVTTKHNSLGQKLIKRVVAGEGQTVRFTDNKVWVDGRALEEGDSDTPEGLFYEEKEILVPKGTVFLLGDNRAESKDSRELGCIPAKEIEGKVLIRIFPWSRIYKTDI